jgi:hypothetical protein
MTILPSLITPSVFLTTLPSHYFLVLFPVTPFRIQHFNLEALLFIHFHKGLSFAWLEASSSLPAQLIFLCSKHPLSYHLSSCSVYSTDTDTCTRHLPIITLLESTGHFSSSRGVPTQSLRTPWTTYLRYLEEPSPKRHPPFPVPYPH